MKKTDLKAVLIGATGLVGSEILKLLLADSRFTSVEIFTRRSVGFAHPKLIENIVNFASIQEWKNKIHGDIAFSALGTTKKEAGSIPAQYQVDYTYQAEFARAAAQGGVETFVLISSMGANSRSKIPYSQMKGQLEDFIESLGFQHIHILRPGPLQGVRQKRRVSEEILVPLTKVLSKLPGLRDLHPVEGHAVAQTAVAASFLDVPLKVFEPSEVRQSHGTPQ